MSISDWSSDVCSSDLDERETVTMIRAVDRLAVQQQPGVTAGLAVAMRAAQIRNAMRDGIPIRRLAEVAPRHRVVEDETRAADEVPCAGVVDAAIVVEEMMKADRKSTRLNSSH